MPCCKITASQAATAACSPTISCAASSGKLRTPKRHADVCACVAFNVCVPQGGEDEGEDDDDEDYEEEGGDLGVLVVKGHNSVAWCPVAVWLLPVHAAAGQAQHASGCCVGAWRRTIAP